MKYTEKEMQAMTKHRQQRLLSNLKFDRALKRKAFIQKDQERKKEIDLLTKIYKEV